MANDYSYFESAFGRGTTNALRRAAQNRARREEDVLGGLLGAGGGADQYMKMRKDLHREGIGQDTDILTQGNMAQAQSLFGAGEAAKARDWQSDMAGEDRAFQRMMYNLQRQGQIEDRDLEMKLAKQKAWMDFGGDILGMLPSLAGLFL